MSSEAAKSETRDVTFLTTRELAVGYRGRAILPLIDLTVRRGEFWAVTGINGSGKTTFLRTLLGLIPRIGGVVEWSSKARVSYVAQRSHVDESVPGRVGDFVRAGCDRGWSFLGWRYGEPDWIRLALEDARCEQLVEQQFSSLSEGQRGRVRLARALVSSPNVVVLDEPTSNVDSVTEQAIFKTLDELRLSRGVTLLVVSHRTHVFAGRATHAIFVDRDGGAAFAGEFDDVVGSPAFLERHGPISPHTYEQPGSSGDGGARAS